MKSNEIKDRKVMHFLVVDDDFTNRALLKEILKEQGEVDIAGDGIEAVAMVKDKLAFKQIFDVIFLDIMMPRMNGQAALIEIRRLEKEAGFYIGRGSKIIMITALGDKDNVKDAFRSQADGYIVKPVERKAIFQQLKKNTDFVVNRL